MSFLERGIELSVIDERKASFRYLEQINFNFSHFLIFSNFEIVE